jgi:hypothetical protein
MLLLVGSIGCLIYLKAVVAFFINSDFKVAPFLILWMVDAIHIRCLVINFGDIKNPKVFDEVIILLEKHSIVRISIKAHSSLLLNSYLIPAWISVTPTNN